MHIRALSRPVMVAAVIVAAIVGAVIGKLMAPVPHTAEVRLVVGSQGLTAQQVPGYTEATIQLAETYARFLTNSAVDTPQTKDVSAVRATAIADSPVIRVEADAKSDQQAIAGANAAAQAIIKAANNSPNSATSAQGTQSLPAQIKAAKSDLTKADNAVAAARKKYNSSHSAADQQKLNAAISDQTLKNFTLTGLGTAYQNAIASSSGAPLEVRVVNDAKVVTDQSKKPLELGALAGAAVAILAFGAMSMLGNKAGVAPARRTRRENDA